MNGFLYFLALAQQVWFMIVHFFPLTLVLAAAWIWAVVAAWSASRGRRWRLFGLGCGPPFALPLGILLCGVVFAHDPPYPPWSTGVEAPAYPQYLILGLLLGHVPLGALLAWWWRSLWPVVAASAILAGYVSLCAAFISGMSVTGVWL